MCPTSICKFYDPFIKFENFVQLTEGEGGGGTRVYPAQTSSVE